LHFAIKISSASINLEQYPPISGDVSRMVKIVIRGSCLFNAKIDLRFIAVPVRHRPIG
jgi:hypothetical protein